MDALQRAAKSAEAARSHAYNADAAAQQLRQRVQRLETDQRTFIEVARQAIASLTSRVASLESDVGELREQLAQIQEKLS